MKANKFYVVMERTSKGTLVCIGREGSYSAGASMHYGYKTLGGAKRFADKRIAKGHESGVYSIQGQSFNNLHSECDHWDLACEAKKQMNPK